MGDERGNQHTDTGYDQDVLLETAGDDAEACRSRNDDESELAALTQQQSGFHGDRTPSTEQQGQTGYDHGLEQPEARNGCGDDRGV